MSSSLFVDVRSSCLAMAVRSSYLAMAARALHTERYTSRNVGNDDPVEDDAISEADPSQVGFRSSLCQGLCDRGFFECEAMTCFDRAQTERFQMNEN